MTALPEIICRVRAIYPFHSNERASLTFAPGDEIDVLSKLESGWWDGWCNGKRGWFPYNYVEVIQEGNLDQYSDIDTNNNDDIIREEETIPQQLQHSLSNNSHNKNNKNNNSYHNINDNLNNNYNNNNNNKSQVYQRSDVYQQRRQQPQQHSNSIMDHRLSFLAYQPQQRSMTTSPPPSNRKYMDDEDYEDAHSDTSLDINLPHGWQLMVADDGETYYYYNHLTGGMRFKHPGLPESDNESDMTSDDDDYNDNINKRSTITSTSTAQPRYFEERRIITADALKRLSVATSDDDSKQDKYHPVPSNADDSLEKIMISWVQRETPQGRPYFCNLITQETTWNYEDIDPLTGHLRKSNQIEDEDMDDEKDSSSQTSDPQFNKGTPTRNISPNNNNNGTTEFMDNENNMDSESSKISWSSLSTDIALSIHQLTTSSQQGHRHKLVVNTSSIVQSIRIMLYASGSMEKDASQTQEPALREPRRAVMASLSKLVLSTKMAAESNVDSANATDTLMKVQKDANDVLASVRNFVTTCQQGQIKIVNIDPRLVNTPADNNNNNNSNSNSNNSNSNNSNNNIAKRKKQNQEEDTKLSEATGMSSTMVQKAKYPLNQDLVVSLRTHANQIYGSTDALSTSVSFLLTLHRGYQHSSDNSEENEHTYTKKHYAQLYEDSMEENHGKANIVHLFRSLSGHLSQFLSILEDIDVPAHMNIDNELPSLRSFQSDKQSLYNGVGQLFNTIQKLTDQLTERTEAVQAIDNAIARVERSMESILTDVGEMVLQRHAWMVRKEEKSSNANMNNENDGTTSNLSPLTPHFYDANEEQQDDEPNGPALALFNGVDDVRRRGTLPSIRKQRTKPTSDDKTITNWFLAPDYKPEELVFSSDNNVKGGTLAALVEKLTMHDGFDLNYLSTFLLTYRSFCATEEFVNLLQDRYNLQAPDDLTPEQLEIWTETKQKLVRLRVFNVLKNWLENYYYEEDEFILGRLEFFTNTVIRDASPFSADQLNRLIRKRKEADNNQAGLKKMVPIKAQGQPSPIIPKNMSNFQLMDTNPKEMARQLSILDFKLYSSIRPIECLNKAWSRDIMKNGVPIAINVIQSIDYCNRLTSWVTHSILEHEEAKKRISVIKYWAHVAEHCRTLNNFNTCMAIISAFDNSAIGRLKKTWELLGNRTSQILQQIRKLMGANRNFTEYREVIHSVNPPCIPFLGIYLQDLTFIEDGNQDFIKKSEGLINFAKRQKCAEVIQEIKQFQSSSYTFHVVPELQEFIKGHLESSRDVETLYERSLQIEPRETTTNVLA
ncbi:ras guanine nucleotide exchange factor domain-containing protein [Cunninghamella echinulata]|nr:ras guanine nucleotide exchange factor domain-containing protein [Cunninghamella echinulata]